jgi:phosphoglucomutase
LAGKPAQPIMLVNVPRLVTAYYSNLPDATLAGQRVAFGTSGHRGSAFENSFNEWHVLAVSQAICDYHRRQGIDSPLFLGIDAHTLSESAYSSAIEVLAAKYAESFRGANHLRRILEEAQTIVGAALAAPTQESEIASATNLKERP